MKQKKARIHLNDILATLRCFEEKKLYRHHKNFYYAYESNIPIIDFIAVSRNMIKASKHMSL